MKTEYIRGIPVVKLSESLVSGVDENLNEAYKAVPEKRRRYIILDFSGTGYINSSGLAALIALVSNASEKGHRIVFSGVNGHVSKVMGLVGLLDHVTVFDSVELALDAAC